jgi:hypothetical protein
MIRLSVPVSDWPIIMICIMIGPSGLLIVVSHLYVILVSFMGAHWGCQKKKN